MTRILFVDTETGGLNPLEHSLLSIGLVVWDSGTIVDEIDVFIRDPIIRFTPESLRVNKIDFLQFIDHAVGVSEAISMIEGFCRKNFSEFPIVLGGHNISFDISFIKHFLGKKYSELFSHRSIDTASILRFLHMGGILPQNCTSSDTAFSFFEIEVSNRHSSLSDARATALLYTKLLNLVQEK